jgi:hypothetical protein
MTAPKSQYSWDVTIKKYKDKIFIDKRDEHNMLDLLTVNETAPYNDQPLNDDTINGVKAIMEEAVTVNNALLYQSYLKDRSV